MTTLASFDGREPVHHTMTHTPQYDDAEQLSPERFRELAARAGWLPGTVELLVKYPPGEAFGIRVDGELRKVRIVNQ